MKKKITLALLALLLAAAAVLPVLRNVEQGPLDRTTRDAAPGQFLELSHGPVHVQLSGPQMGVPVVLVPGFSVPSYVWEPLDARLAAAGFRVVRFDLYGRGWSARPDVVYDRDLYSEQLRELMDALHIERAHVIGLSMGGAIAGRFTAQHPDRVATLTLIAPFTYARDIAPLQWPLLGEWMNRVYVLPKLAASQMSDFVHPERHAGWAGRFLPQMRYDGFGRAILSTLRNVMTQDSLGDFAVVGALHREVMLVWGRRDLVVPFAHSEAVRGAIPQAQFVAVDEAGHLPHVEQPELVAKTLIEFLAAPPNTADDRPGS